MTSAISYYERALELDPEFAAAHSAMARARIALANHSQRAGPRIPRAGARVGAAIDRDRSGHFGRAPRAGRDPADARMELARWPKTNTERPSRCRRAASRRTGSTRSFSRRCRASAKRKPKPIARATSIRSVSSSTTSAAWVRYAAGEFDAAIDRSRHVLDMDAGYMPARRLLGAALLAAGRPDEAVVELTAAAGRDGDDPISLAWLAHAKALAGDRRRSGCDRREARSELAAACYVPAYHLALAHTGLGNRDAAFALLEKACADREPAVDQSQGRAAVRAAPPRPALRRSAAAASICPNRTARHAGRFVPYCRPQFPAKLL